MDHTVNIFYVWLVLLNIMSEISIPVVACSRVCIFLCCIVFHCVNLPQFIYPCIVDGHKVCFWFEIITNNASMNILLAFFFFLGTCALSVGYIFRSGLRWLLRNVYVSFRTNSTQFSKMVTPISHSYMLRYAVELYSNSFFWALNIFQSSEDPS